MKKKTLSSTTKEGNKAVHKLKKDVEKLKKSPKKKGKNYIEKFDKALLKLENLQRKTKAKGELTHQIMEILTCMSEEMNVQDNRSEAYPMFVVMDTEKDLVSRSMDYDLIERTDWGQQCEKCCELEDKGKTLPDECDDCEEECFAYFKEEQRIQNNAGMFFTAKGCQDHIDANHYHYNKPKVYGISPWRNDEMQTVLKFLQLLSSKTLNMPK